MKKNRDRLEEARQLLIHATKILSDIVEDRAANESDLEDWMKDRVELWCRVYNAGGVIAQEKLHEIWRDEMGKDTRGLGGFFVGRNASLAWTPDDKVVLTKSAAQWIEAWIGKSISEYAKNFKK